MARLIAVPAAALTLRKRPKITTCPMYFSDTPPC